VLGIGLTLAPDAVSTMEAGKLEVELSLFWPASVYMQNPQKSAQHGDGVPHNGFATGRIAHTL
jgi:hypothetical protein